jgi:hypothetical protein
MPEPDLNLSFEPTQEDIALAWTVKQGSRRPCLAFELAIHRTLDERGIPRRGRAVHVTKEQVIIDLPRGYHLKDIADV